RFPELYRRLVKDLGAEVLLVPAAFTAHTGGAHWHLLLRARAIEDQAWVVAPARWAASAPRATASWSPRSTARPSPAGAPRCRASITPCCGAEELSTKAGNALAKTLTLTLSQK